MVGRFVAKAVLVLAPLSPGLVAQTVVVHVARIDRAPVLGLDAQLRALVAERGQLTVTSGAEMPAPKAGADLVVEVAWVPADADRKGFRAAKVQSSDPARADSWLAMALAGEGPFGEIGASEALPGAVDLPWRVRFEFAEPRTGASKARQFRHVRRFVAVALRELGMGRAELAPWPMRFPAPPTIGLYDAEGVGGSGCESLERAVDETTFGHRLLPVCPEDIRDGGLKPLAGVIFPGGSGGGIAKALGPSGVAAVRAYVDGGGGYVGICAGAYFAGSGLDSYAALLPWRHSQPWAKGSANLDLELTAAGKRLFGAEFARFRTRYNNGPVYPDVLGQSKQAGREQPPQVLANFASAAKDKKGVVHEAMVGTPAIVADTFGKGRVMLVSPHPETHRELNVLVARALAWAVGTDPATVGPRPERQAR